MRDDAPQEVHASIVQNAIPRALIALLQRVFELGEEGDHGLALKGCSNPRFTLATNPGLKRAM
jgi:hypothetical protein